MPEFGGLRATVAACASLSYATVERLDQEEEEAATPESDAGGGEAEKERRKDAEGGKKRRRDEGEKERERETDAATTPRDMFPVAPSTSPSSSIIITLACLIERLSLSHRERRRDKFTAMHGMQTEAATGDPRPGLLDRGKRDKVRRREGESRGDGRM